MVHQCFQSNGMLAQQDLCLRHASFAESDANYARKVISHSLDFHFVFLFHFSISEDELSDEDGPRPSKSLKLSKRTTPSVKKPKKSSSLPPASEADDREQPAARPSVSSPMAGPSNAKRAKVASLSKTPASISKSMASTPVNGSKGARKRKSNTPKHVTKGKYPFLDSDDEEEDKLQIVEIDDDDSEKESTEVRPVGQDEGSGQGKFASHPFPKLMFAVHSALDLQTKLLDSVVLRGFHKLRLEFVRFRAVYTSPKSYEL